MKEVIERMRRAEEEAAGLLQQAEEEANRILESARQRARQAADEKRRAAHQQAEELLAAARLAARDARQALMTRNDDELKKVAQTDPDARDQAISLIFRSVTRPSSPSAQPPSGAGS